MNFKFILFTERAVRENNMAEAMYHTLLSITCDGGDVTAIPAPRSNPRSIPPNFITVYTVTDRYFRTRHNKEETRA